MKKNPYVVAESIGSKIGTVILIGLYVILFGMLYLVTPIIGIANQNWMLVAMPYALTALVVGLVCLAVWVERVWIQAKQNWGSKHD